MPPVPSPSVRLPPHPTRRGVAGLGGQVPGIAFVACGATLHRWQPPVCAQGRNQGHVLGECLAAPRLALNDKVEPVPVILRNAWRGGSRQPLLGDKTRPSTASRAMRTGTGGMIVSPLVNHGSALCSLARQGWWQTKASPRRLACPEVGVAYPRLRGWLATTHRHARLPGKAKHSKARELGDKVQRRRSR